MDALNLITGLFVALSCGALAIGCGIGAFIARRASQERALSDIVTPPVSRCVRNEAVMPRPVSWLAIRSRDIEAVRNALGLQNIRECSYVEAITGDQSIFIAAPIQGWILVSGADLPEPGEDVDACYKFVLRLSRRLGHVQFFSATELSNRHAWIKADRGRVVRAYVWADRTQWIQGPVTQEERELGLASYPYGSELDLDTVDCDVLAQTTERVPLLAARWSIDPATIDPAWLETRPGIAGECS